MERKHIKGAEDLDGLVQKLEEISANRTHAKPGDVRSDCILVLQEIEKILLSTYLIEIGGLCIEPLLIEIYYHDKVYFKDSNVHQKPAQKNCPGTLYLHTVGEGGADIVLSCGDYYLSVLLKNVLFENDPTLVSQVYIHNRLSAQTNHDVTFKKRSSPKSSQVVYLRRKNTYKGNFKNTKLAAFLYNDLYRIDLGSLAPIELSRGSTWREMFALKNSQEKSAYNCTEKQMYWKASMRGIKIE